MPLPTAMAADLQRSVVLMFCATQIDLPSGPLRSLTDGAGFVTFEVDGVPATFVARDATYGVVGGVTEIVDGVATQAPTVSMNLFPKTNAAMAALAAPEVQRSRMRVWVGTVNRATGQVTGIEQWYDGDTNVPTQNTGKQTRVLSMTVNSALMKFLEPDEGARLNDGFHRKGWPLQRGLQHINSVEMIDVWGSEAPRSPVAYAPPVSSRLPENLR